MKPNQIPTPVVPMKTPRFTDGKFTTHPYVPAIATDIAKTFERARAQIMYLARKAKRINRS